MSYGYTTRLVRLNKEADKTNLGVKLGRMCIRKEVPVVQVSLELGVSRMAVYNWFSGSSEPSDRMTDAITTLIAEYRQR
tara:strand:+ start:1191 stop:1427 length:237 start_codon:yes stop_codon:yes gene_type:complete